MINKNLMPQAYKEVLEILKYIPSDELDMIPQKIIKYFEKNKDEKHDYKVTHFDDFKNQEMLKETEAILATLFRNYWATDNQKEKICEKEKNDIQKLEEEKRKKYNPNDVFKHTDINNISKSIEEKSLVKIDKCKWYKRIFLRLFKKYKS